MGPCFRWVLIAGLLVLACRHSWAEEKQPAYIGLQWKEESEGLVVNAVLPNSPAARANLQEGDIISKLNGQPVDSNFTTAISSLEPNTEIELTTERGGLEKKVKVRLGERPQFLEKLESLNPPRVPGSTILMSDKGAILGGLQGISNFVQSEGTSNIGGNLELTWGSLFDLEINDRKDSTGVVVQGGVALSGILYVNFNNVQPKLGDEFTLIRNAASLKGKFGKLMLPKLPDGLRWKIVYDDLAHGLDLNGNGKYDVTLLVIKDGSGHDRP